MSDEGLPNITRLSELDGHLDLLDTSPETPVNEKLLDDVELQLNESNSLPLIPKFLPKLISILFKLQQDPSAIVSFAIKLIKPIPFNDILAFTNEESLILALQSHSTAANLLALEVVAKATKSSSNVALLSVMKNLVTHLIRTWLSHPEVGVSSKAGDVLADGLETDSENPLPVKNDLGNFETREGGQGLLWRRIFFDQDILGIILSMCDRDSSTLDPRTKTLAQSRLSAIMPRLAQINFPAITQSTLPELESRYYHSESSKGLLYFVANRMVDPASDDELLRITHYQFWYELFEALSKVQYSESMRQTLMELVSASIEQDSNLKPFLKSLVSQLFQRRQDDVMELLKGLDLGIEGDDVEMGMSL